MFIKHLHDCEEFVAGDNTQLRELLHPDKQPLSIRYSLAHATVKPGLTSFEHALETSEIYYILQGNGLMFINDEQSEVSAGHVIYIAPKSRQCIKNIGKEDLLFLCIVDPAWRIEDEIVYNTL